MGMAASQARLLALTSRMHDIELRAQNLESQKLSLATQEDAAYQKYCDALDATKIQVGKTDISTGKISYVDANFKSVCGFQFENVRQYSLINNLTGKVIVSPDIKALYEQYGQDRYTFAWAALGYGDQFGWSGADGPFSVANSNPPTSMFLGSGGWEFIGIGTNENYGTDPGQDLIPTPNPDASGLGLWDENDMPAIGCGTDLYMTEAEYLVFLQHQDDDVLMGIYDELLESSRNEDPVSKRKQLLKEFRDTLYSKYGQEILNAMNQNKNWPPEDPAEQPTDIPQNLQNNTDWENLQSEFRREFTYYENLWDQIDKAGGCEVIDEQYISGDEGTEWFNNMITSGLVSIYMLDTTKTDKGWEVTTIATSVGNNYLQEVNDEEKAKKAEAEYDHEMKIINRKDTKFDTALKKLETEENACKTEIDSIKKVKDENIERTFNLFS